MTIAIIDYQMGNLRSVQKAFEHLGHHAIISDSPRELLAAEKVVLPGVGAFRDAIGELRRRELVEPIREIVASGRPFLGICLGLQLLMDVSFEDGEYEGLGIVPGEVRRFVVPHDYKVPHMGWNQVRRRREHPMLEGIDDGSYFYFVHSYFVSPSDPSWVALESDYGGPFCAAVARGNVFASQFHPEKSQTSGQRLLQNFAQASMTVNG